MSGEPDIQRRLAAWRVSADARDLWPEITETEFYAARDAIGRATRSVLARADATLDTRVPPRALGIAAFATGLGPLLGYWLETGRLSAEADHASVLRAHLDRSRERATTLDRALGRVLDAFAARGLEPTVLKGAHTAWAYFPEPGTRPAGDIDLLMHPNHATQARATLAELDFEESDTQGLPFRSGWTPRHGPKVPRTLDIEDADNPWSVDLHTSLDRAYAFAKRTGLGESPPVTVATLGGRNVRVLPQPHLLTYLAFNASSEIGRLRLLPLVELVFVIRRDLDGAPELWNGVEALVEARNLERFVYPALALAESLKPGTVPEPVLDRLSRRVPHLMRRTVQRMRPEDAQQPYRRSLDVHVMPIASAGEALRYAREKLFSGKTLARRIRRLARARWFVRHL